MADSISTFTVNAGAGGAAAGVKLVWHVAMSSCTVWSQQMLPSAGVQSRGNREEFASGRLACAQCAQMCEAESVSQREDSMLHAAKKVGKLQ